MSTISGTNANDVSAFCCSVYRDASATSWTNATRAIIAA